MIHCGDVLVIQADILLTIQIWVCFCKTASCSSFLCPHWAIRKTERQPCYLSSHPGKQTLSTWKDWCWSTNTFGHMMWTADSLKMTLMLGEIEGRRRRGRQRMRQLDSITDSMDMNLGKLWGMVRDREACCGIVHGVSKSQTWLDNWTTTTKKG